MALVHTRSNRARLRNALKPTLGSQQMAASEQDMNNTSQDQNDGRNSSVEKKPGQQGHADGKDLGGEDLAGQQGQQQQQPSETETGQPSPGQNPKAGADRDSQR